MADRDTKIERAREALREKEQEPKTPAEREQLEREEERPPEEPEPPKDRGERQQ